MTKFEQDKINRKEIVEKIYRRNNGSLATPARNIFPKE